MRVHDGMVAIMSGYATSVSPEVQQMLSEYRISDIAMLRAACPMSVCVHSSSCCRAHVGRSASRCR